MSSIGSARRAIVIGSGASGASAAFRLRQAGMAVRMVERDSRVGGRMRTEHINGFVVDIGAGLMPGTYKAVQRLMQDAGLIHLLDQVNSPTAIMRDRRMHYPELSGISNLWTTNAMPGRGGLCHFESRPCGRPRHTIILRTTFRTRTTSTHSDW